MALNWVDIRESQTVSVEPIIVKIIGYTVNVNNAESILYDSHVNDSNARRFHFKASTGSFNNINLGEGLLFVNGLYVDISADAVQVVIGYEFPPII